MSCSQALFQATGLPIRLRKCELTTFVIKIGGGDLRSAWTSKATGIELEGVRIECEARSAAVPQCRRAKAGVAG